MKVLIIGNGGREHAIARKIAQSPQNPELHLAPGNPGMASLGKCHKVGAEDIGGLLQLAKDIQPDLTLVGPEVPLVMGIVDLFNNEGLAVFGPDQYAAQLEGSKAFAKAFMDRYKIPTARYQKFTELEAAQNYIDQEGAPIVVKASGLAAGKGAIVCPTRNEAKEAINSMLGPDAVFGEAGKEVVIEECMVGEEASILAICDGKDYVLLPSSQDHKRVFDNDEGPNTGGMGAYAPAPVVTPAILEKTEKSIIQPVLNGMSKEGHPFVGVLYAGLMITSEGPKVVEFNVRLGDPECQVVLPLYDGDLLALFQTAIKGQLNTITPQSVSKSAAIVVLASGGYPGSYAKGKPISGLDSPDLPNNLHIIHAGTKTDGGNIVTSGGRVLGIVGIGNNLKEAIDTAYKGTEIVRFENAHFRKDIAKKGLARI